MNKKLSSSEQRFDFQKERYLERKLKEGKTMDNDPDLAAMMDFFDKEINDARMKEYDEVWAKHNLEYDLRSTDWILEKVRKNDYYAQNLYAALCNNLFQKLELIPVLKDETWGCSWRGAGGIVADMRGQGDYIDWYCSGIRGGLSYDDDTLPLNYMPEGQVSSEIESDLERLGWRVLPSEK